ncbi:NAD(P)-binding protein [Teratosphaeria destructans]|uniref:NAD(P)-binding protein n=1 Tax=Teratosphaeria destructans TaxID=418781 RepID=A0A9W7W657_9PEZI|nr:NAD(P)-binding protein [Teratosphaeria destructans]
MMDFACRWLWTMCLIPPALSYLVIVRALRYKLRDAATKKIPSRPLFASMTLEDAFPIQLQLAELEFPTVFSGSVFFALFKTYGIPSISRLLTKTGQLSSSATASKRAADTGVILTEVVLHPPNSPRAIEGIARMNFLHDRYRKSGKITDDDMLYTLSLFLLEPIRWTKRFDWREVSDVERCAMGLYWRWMADAMDIPLDALGSAGKWKDGLDFLEDLETWSLRYEIDTMKPADCNETVAKHTIDIALHNLPKMLHRAIFDIVSSLLDLRLRTAMKFAEPASITVVMLDLLVDIRRMIVRHLFLPRPYFLRQRWFSDEPTIDGRYHFAQYIAHPWYIKPTWSKRIVGGAVPGDEGDKYCPHGYKIAELGPQNLCGKGDVEMDQTRRRLASGCPFRLAR